MPSQLPTRLRLCGQFYEKCTRAIQARLARASLSFSTFSIYYTSGDGNSQPRADHALTERPQWGSEAAGA